MQPDGRYEGAAVAAARCRELLAPQVDVVTPPGQSTLVSFRASGDPTELVAALADRGVIVRERGRRIRDIAQRLSERFRQSQLGSCRPALTVDDGTAVVTDNYLKLRIAAGHARNEHVRVQVLSAHDGAVV